MALRDLLARLWPRRSNPVSDEQNRRAAADRLERNTQAHYRSITQSDASGRPTKNDEPPA
jgi:hypothetical protein